MTLDDTGEQEGNENTSMYGVLCGERREDGYKDWVIRCTLPNDLAACDIAESDLASPTMDLQLACMTMRECIQSWQPAVYPGSTITPIDVCDTLSAVSCLLSPVWNARVAEIEDEQRGVLLYVAVKDVPELAQIDAGLREAFWFSVEVFEGRP